MAFLVWVKLKEWKGFQGMTVQLKIPWPISLASRFFLKNFTHSNFLNFIFRWKNFLRNLHDDLQSFSWLERKWRQWMLLPHTNPGGQRWDWIWCLSLRSMKIVFVKLFYFFMENKKNFWWIILSILILIYLSINC
jgi:hypothetical protein